MTVMQGYGPLEERDNGDDSLTFSCWAVIQISLVQFDAARGSTELFFYNDLSYITRASDNCFPCGKIFMYSF